MLPRSACFRALYVFVSYVICQSVNWHKIWKLSKRTSRAAQGHTQFFWFALWFSMKFPYLIFLSARFNKEYNNTRFGCWLNSKHQLSSIFVEKSMKKTKRKNYILWLASCIPALSLDKVIKKTLKLELRWPTNIFYIPPQYFYQLKCKYVPATTLVVQKSAMNNSEIFISDPAPASWI